MANDDENLRLLASIDRRLALLTVSEERNLRHLLGTELLRTPARIAMFEAIDGKSDSAELARVSGASKRSAQEFTKEFTELGLVRPGPASTGRAVIVERDEGAIFDWYLQQVASN